MTQTTTQATFEIPDYNLTYLEGRVGKVAKRAEKLGLPAPTIITVSERFETFIFDPSSREQTPRRFDPEQTYSDRWQKKIIRLVTVAVAGEVVQLGGWQFVGRVDNVEGEAIIAESKGQAVPDQYRQNDFTCDHCHADRNRKAVFVLFNEDEARYAQVGSTCLKDFFNSDNPQAYADFATALFDVEAYLASLAVSSGEFGGQSTQYVNTRDFFAWAVRLTDQDGYKSRQYHSYTTADQALDLVQGFAFTRANARRAHENQVPITAEELERAGALLVEIAAHFNAIDEAARTNYEHNLAVLLLNYEPGTVHGTRIKHAGLVASSYAAWKRIEKDKVVAEAGKTSEFVGTEGQRIEVALTIQKVIFLGESQYGNAWLYIFNDADGNVLTWKTGNGYFRDAAEGYPVTGKATIKKHEVYTLRNAGEGIKQTQLTRCKFDEWNEVLENLNPPTEREE